MCVSCLFSSSLDSSSDLFLSFDFLPLLSLPPNLNPNSPRPTLLTSKTCPYLSTSH